MQRPILVDNVLELIGNTPLVRLNRVAPRDGATVWGKCEMLNPGGSVKDRIALAMVEAAERDGLIRPGESTLVEPTSGNTGIGLALVSAVKGYKLILTMPESMSLERRNLLRAYGAQIVLTPEDRTMEGAVSLAEELCRQPNHVMLQQFRNPANPDVHRRTTGPEILAQMQGLSIDGFVAGVGTGGTVTGVGSVLRQHNSAVRIVAVEPDKSPVLSGGKPGPHKIQGIGAGFVPSILERELIDEVVKVPNEMAFEVARMLARLEGIPGGISTGANLAAALTVAARDEMAGRAIVTFAPSAADRYLSTELFPQE
jgi:cysteine synthase A